jgi:hypothetical protein
MVPINLSVLDGEEGGAQTCDSSPQFLIIVYTLPKQRGCKLSH